MFNGKSGSHCSNLHIATNSETEHKRGLVGSICTGINSARNLGDRLYADESGQDLIEYALVAALIGLGAVATMRGLQNAIGTAFNAIGSNLTSSVGA
jgi:pilus assembly protein Flp/PilA